MLREQLEQYVAAMADQAAVVGQFRAFLEEPDSFQRSRPDGHFTGAAWLVSADGQRVLLTHHRKLDRWLQLGG